VLGFLAAGSTSMAIGLFIGVTFWQSLAGWLFVASAALAMYLASAMMLEASYKRVILPLGKANAMPGAIVTHPIQYAAGQPGVRVGQ
jgi:hypothetical protein